jgi:hypothetical protein
MQEASAFALLWLTGTDLTAGSRRGSVGAAKRMRWSPTIWRSAERPMQQGVPAEGV